MAHKPARNSVLRFAGSSLRLATNPVSKPSSAASSTTDLTHNIPLQDNSINDETVPQFVKRQSASTFELFYDLWFVANLNVFGSVHHITNETALSSFIGYFLLLWITWLLTSLFDARFGQDGIVERVARGFHLAVMVGFAEVGTTINRSSDVASVLRTMSLFLMVSRFILSLQYAGVLYCARHHPRSRRPLVIAIIAHMVPAFIYLGLTIMTGDMAGTHLFHIWYSVSLAEMCFHVAHATFSSTLSFNGTHFHERLNLLTLIIIGEGAIILAKNVTILVDNTYIKHVVDHWSPSLIGIITSATAILYMIYQLYFDWMHHHTNMSVARQAYWVLTHLPFHVALVLLVEGSSQWSVWWRSMEAIQDAANQLGSAVISTQNEASANNQTTSSIVGALEATTYQLLKVYLPEDPVRVQSSLDEAFSAIAQIPDTFWRSAAYQDPDHMTSLQQSWSTEYTVIATTIFNAIHDSFDTSAIEDGVFISDNLTELGDQSIEMYAYEKTASMHRLVAIYVFATAGEVLMLLAILHILSKRKGWTAFNVLRTAIVATISLSLAMCSLLAAHVELLTAFLMTPWQVPMVAICYAVVLVITHLPHPKRFGWWQLPGEKDAERNFAGGSDGGPDGLPREDLRI